MVRDYLQLRGTVENLKEEIYIWAILEPFGDVWQEKKNTDEEVVSQKYYN